MLPASWAIHSLYEFFYMIDGSRICGSPGITSRYFTASAALDIDLVDEHLLHFKRGSPSANRMRRGSTTTIWAIEHNEVVVLSIIHVLGEIDIRQHDCTFMPRFIKDHLHAAWDEFCWPNT